MTTTTTTTTVFPFYTATASMTTTRREEEDDSCDTSGGFGQGGYGGAYPQYGAFGDSEDDMDPEPDY